MGRIGGWSKWLEELYRHTRLAALGQLQLELAKLIAIYVLVLAVVPVEAVPVEDSLVVLVVAAELVVEEVLVVQRQAFMFLFLSCQARLTLLLLDRVVLVEQVALVVQQDL
jgi:hypothetical protein